MYRVRKAVKLTYGKEDVSYFICDPILPVYHLCKFLDLKGKNSINTQKTYSSILVQWVNYLYKRNKIYYEVTYDDLKKYLYSLIFLNKKNQYILTPERTYLTIKMKQTIIIDFYNFLSCEKDVDSSLRFYDNKNEIINYNFKLDINKLEKVASNTIDFFMTKYKRSRKENYILEYSEEEILRIHSHFNLLRDKAVFYLTLFGLRIDEVLSIKVKDFNYLDNVVRPSRSKSNEFRHVVISEYVSNIINNYIQTERISAITDSGKNSEFLFININKGIYCGENLKYSTFYTSLKRAAINAGFNSNEIRTHSGRSTRTMQLFKKDNITDEMIRHIMGWKSPSSMKSYIDENNKSLSLKGAKFLANMNNKENL